MILLRVSIFKPADKLVETFSTSKFYYQTTPGVSKATYVLTVPWATLASVIFGLLKVGCFQTRFECAHYTEQS